MRMRQKVESLLPEVPREIIKGMLRRLVYPDYGFTLNGAALKAYTVGGASPATWSADFDQPYGTLMDEYRFPHFLLARAVTRAFQVDSWCDLGTGCATLPFQVARFGVAGVLAIDGSGAAVSAGKVPLPLSNYFVADVCLPLDVREGDGRPARFDVVSALELVEHIPDSKLQGLFANIRRLDPGWVILAIGLQPEPPYHVNLKTMAEWLGDLSFLLRDWSYDDVLSEKIFLNTRRHDRFRNEYPTNHLPGQRNLLIFRKRGAPPKRHPGD